MVKTPIDVSDLSLFTIQRLVNNQVIQVFRSAVFPLSPNFPWSAHAEVDKGKLRDDKGKFIGGRHSRERDREQQRELETESSRGRQRSAAGAGDRERQLFTNSCLFLSISLFSMLRWFFGCNVHDERRRTEDERRRVEGERCRAGDERRRAEDERRRAEDERRRAEDERRHAEDERRRAEQLVKEEGYCAAREETSGTTEVQEAADALAVLRNTSQRTRIAAVENAHADDTEDKRHRTEELKEEGYYVGGEETSDTTKVQEAADAVARTTSQCENLKYRAEIGVVDNVDAHDAVEFDIGDDDMADVEVADVVGDVDVGEDEVDSVIRFDRVLECAQWLAYPSGNTTKVFEATYDEVKCTGWALNTKWQNGNSKSGKFTIHRKCAGVSTCRKCLYRARPMIAKKSGSKYIGKKAYHVKNYRKYCRGLCFEKGNKSLKLIEVPCECTVTYRSEGDGTIRVSHVGEHDHDRPSAVRFSAAEDKRALDELSRGQGKAPKKKAQRPNLGPRIRIWMPYVDSSGVFRVETSSFRVG